MEFKTDELIELMRRRGYVCLSEPEYQRLLGAIERLEVELGDVIYERDQAEGHAV